MKKVYTKPVVVFENFEVDASIASGANCTNVATETMLEEIENALELAWGADVSIDSLESAAKNKYGYGDGNNKFCYFTHSDPNFIS